MFRKMLGGDWYSQLGGPVYTQLYTQEDIQDLIFNKKLYEEQKKDVWCWYP